jgi:hypothetical protein
MRWIRNYAIILILMWLVGACLKQPENSIVPLITYQSIVFKHETPAAVDTLIVTVKFTDGDGDLGINGDETAIYTSATDSTDINTPFYYVYDSAKNNIWYYTHKNNLVLPKGIHYVNYASYRKFHTFPFDTLSAAVDCAHWEFRSNPADTLAIRLNPYYNNFFMDVFTKNPDGTYTYIDPLTYYSFKNGCDPDLFNGRFPILPSDLGKKSSLDGTIVYKYISAGIYTKFHGQTLKVKVYILDRAFHRSNTVESDDIAIK